MLEFFGRLRIVCVSKSFLYQLQTRVLYRVIWAFWQYMQVRLSWLLDLYSLSTNVFIRLKKSKKWKWVKKKLVEFWTFVPMGNMILPGNIFEIILVWLLLMFVQT